MKKQLLTAALAVCALTAGAKAADENGELRRRQHNAAQLSTIHAPSRPKFAAAVRDLEAHGQRPFIVCAYRSPHTQAAIQARGNSRVAWSFHNAQTPQGKPDALAADFVDARWFYQRGHGDFWLMLASAAQSHDLWTGIRWELPNADRRRIDALIAARDWRGAYRVGYDPGHVEVTGLTLAQARRGVRP